MKTLPRFVLCFLFPPFQSISAPAVFGSLFLLVFATASFGAVLPSVITPIGVTTSTSGDFLPVGHLIDDSGFSQPPYDASAISVHSEASAWVTDSVGYPRHYFDTHGPAVLAFDLGGIHSVTDVVLWNYGSSPGGGHTNGASSFSVEFSTTGVYGVFAEETVIQPAVVPSSTVSAETFSLAEPVLADAVRFTITDNHGGDRIGLNEVKFQGTFISGSPRVTLVPRGGTWKYLDDGSNQDTAWTVVSFADNFWAAGPAELGYGDEDEQTIST